MNVLLTKPFFDSDIEYIKSHLKDGINLIRPNAFDELSLVNLAPDADVLFGGLISESVLEVAQKLKFIQIPWTGVDNLNFDLINKYNVVVCNSHSNSSVVAEHAIALMFDAAKKLTYHDRLMRKGNWNRPGINTNQITPFSKKISKSTIAIIGFGSIGKNIYKMMKGFDCNFKVFNRVVKPNICDGLENISYHSINDVYDELKGIDFVFVSLPLTQDTKGIIDKKLLNSMNNESVLINVSRGEVLEENDLYNALVNKDIAFAGIDTWFNYPNKSNPEVFPSDKYKFHQLDNIILSPHRAGFIDEGFPHLDDAIENLNRMRENEPLINIVSTKDRY